MWNKMSYILLRLTDFLLSSVNNFTEWQLRRARNRLGRNPEQLTGQESGIFDRKGFADIPYLYQVLFIWRPHPLLKETLIKALLDWGEKYDSIVKSYLDEGWGIYNDKPNMYRAIALSDMYYGDWSSVVSLYQMTGKPILLQNVNT